MVTSEPPPALLAPHLRKANQAAPLGAWSLWRTIGPGGGSVERAERARELHRRAVYCTMYGFTRTCKMRCTVHPARARAETSSHAQDEQ